ncbi:MAG: hypothetical protein ABEK02_07750 [Haloquadratum sp.]
MPLSEDEWESGRQWDDIERAVAEFLDAVAPRAYAVGELHDLLVDGGVVVAPEDDTWDDEDDGPEEVEVAAMDVTEREVRKATTDLRDADYLESKQVQTDDGFVTYYRRADCGFL